MESFKKSLVAADTSSLQENIQGISPQPFAKDISSVCQRCKLNLSCVSRVQSQYMQTLRLISSVSETWWLELQGFQSANSTVRASLYLSANTTQVAAREDVVTLEKLYSCTCKPYRFFICFFPQKVVIVAEMKFWFFTIEALMNLQMML